MSDIESNPNPDPRNWSLSVSNKVGPFTVALVRYHSCVNYEGHQVLIVRGEIVPGEPLDPHFTEDGRIAARFEPTPDGYATAIRVAAMMAGDSLWKPDEGLGEHPEHSDMEWTDAVVNGDTELGYRDWVGRRLLHQHFPGDMQDLVL